jgi:predicted enzyme related to lactoylglutathione lyase
VTTEGIKTVLIPVSDAATSKPLYEALLGAQPQMDQPYYVGWDVGGQAIGLVPHRPDMTAPVCYAHVDDIHDTLARVHAAGATVQQEPTDVGGGKLVATVQDPDGNVVGIIQAP